MITYLACPYLHIKSDVQQERYNQVTEVAAALMCKGEVVYSPITSMHYLAQTYVMPNRPGFWLDHDLTILAVCDKLIVLQLEGWQFSEGLRREIAFATEKNIPIEYMEFVGGSWLK